MVMLQYRDPCPLSGTTPSEEVTQWLQTFTLPVGQLPGTSSTDTHCPRNGELDVALVQLISLTLKNLSALTGPSLANIKSVIAPWGGPPRDDPYVTPDGHCYGRSVIESENHILLQETARYLSNSMRGAPNAANRDWLVRFLQQIVRRDFYEFNALPYSRYQLKALFALYDYARDDSVHRAAEGALDWLFAKQALSANLDRDQRPYRRRPDAGILGAKDWWSEGATATSMAMSILAGPVQHIHTDLDLQLDNKQAADAITDMASHAALGTTTSFFAAALVDVANTHYQLPNALGILVRATVHSRRNQPQHLCPGDPSWVADWGRSGLLQAGQWRRRADLGKPQLDHRCRWFIRPARLAGDAANHLFGLARILSEGITDVIADSKQSDVLWDTQPGILRETILIQRRRG